MNELELCKCKKHPSTHPNDFSWEGEEYGSMDKLIAAKFKTTCKTCSDVFHGGYNTEYFNAKTCKS